MRDSVGRPLILRPSRGWVSLRLSEVWAYRELLYFLAWRDIKVRYTQTALGAAWAVIQPLFKMIVFSIFFGRLANIESKLADGMPYPLFVFSGLVVWQFFEYAMAQSTESLVGSANLIKKVYFPRLIIPLASVVAGLLDFLIAMVVLVGIMIYYGKFPAANIAFLPAFLVLAVVTSLGVGLWLSALNVHYRDVKYTLGFLIQFWMFATPIAYPSTLLSEPWRTWYGVNPMAGVVEGFRWALLGAQTPPGPMLWVSAAASLVMFVTGLFYFRRMERTFADLI